jgi:Fe-S cluster biogenesis protein NfuA
MSGSLPSQLRDRVEVVLDRLRPALVADGGNVELAEVADDGTVSVILQGACATCPAQGATLRHGIEAGLRREIPEITTVIALPS